MSYRDRLFAEYSATHAGFLGADDDVRLQWFREHARQNYLPAFSGIEPDAAILEIGCGPGYFLEVLRERGYRRLTGVDLSPADLEIARSVLRLEDVHLEDAATFLKRHQQRFDVIVAKAILEHVEKGDVFELLECIHDALRPGGRVVIEVPNMDWIFAQHERYVDFTHEIGFTPQSLAQVLRTVFGNAEISAASEVLPPSRRIRLKHRLFGPLARGIVGMFIEYMGDGARKTWWATRSIIGVAARAPAVEAERTGA